VGFSESFNISLVVFEGAGVEGDFLIAPTI
jgi:hypothetical protein